MPSACERLFWVTPTASQCFVVKYRFPHQQNYYEAECNGRTFYLADSVADVQPMAVSDTDFANVRALCLLKGKALERLCVIWRLTCTDMLGAHSWQT